MQPNKKIKFARCAGWAANTWADSLRSDFSPHIRVPYLKVSSHMSPLYRSLIILETIVCFGPITIALAMGLIFIPMALNEALKGNFWLTPLVLLILFGFLGLFAVISLILHIFDPTKIFLSRYKLFAYTGVGVISLISVVPLFNITGYGYLVVLLPLFATCHFYYLSRVVWQNGC
ncbi:hypothetical protein Glaag_1829 [Glaciecola sp. 4H-3-7+YE-5]|jgi:hypothetical protein|nr:hypothetical protein Glaag_1829 [Glaciecola sp. 4H-3-7+YE-5]